MKKTVRLIFVLCLLLLLSITVMAAEGSNGFNAHLDVETFDDGSILVTIPEENDAILAELKPTLSIPCGFESAKVTKDGELIPSEIQDGQVTFTVAAAGEYHIEDWPTVLFAAYSTDTAFKTSVCDVGVDKNPVHLGETVTLTAYSRLGYNFLGWYRVLSVSEGYVTECEAEPVSTDPVYTFEVEGDVSLAAVYEASTQKFKLNVQAINGAKFRVNGGDVQTGYSEEVTLGTEVTIAAVEPDKVLQWQNDNDKLMGKGADLTVIVTGNTTVKLVYNSAEEGQSFVQFVSDYGQALSYQQYSASGIEGLTFPDSPVKFGYVFDKWVIEGTETEATVGSIRVLIEDGVKIITIKPLYTEDDTRFTVTVKYLDQDGNEIHEADTYEELRIGTSRTFTAPEIDGYTFARWEKADGTELGYNTGYYMRISGDMVLNARYTAEETEVKPKPVITLGEPAIVPAIVEGDVLKVSCTATRSVPEGYTIIEHGILYARGVEGLNAESFVCGTELPPGAGKYISNATQLNGTVKLNVKLTGEYNESTLVTFRGYMLLKNTETQNEEFYYTDVVTCTYESLAGRG